MSLDNVLGNVMVASSRLVLVTLLEGTENWCGGEDGSDDDGGLHDDCETIIKLKEGKVSNDGMSRECVEGGSGIGIRTRWKEKDDGRGREEVSVRTERPRHVKSSASASHPLHLACAPPLLLTTSPPSP